MVVEDPWYKKTWLLAAAGAGLLIVVVLALLNILRRPKAAPAAAMAAPSLDAMHDEEHELLDRLALQPDDTGAHLELLSLYYARQEVEKFEDAAQAMYAHLGANEAAEWEQVKAMGQELAPHNPLFSESVSGSSGYDSHPTSHHDSMSFDAFEDAHALASPPPAPSHAEDAFDFDLTDHSAPPSVAKTAAVDNFTMTMPAMDFDKELHVDPIRVPEPPQVSMPAPPQPRMEDDFGIGSEDATGTKLDLAKAYLDMGDPEGARSMLEEVVAEGTAAQKAEANKLIKELR